MEPMREAWTDERLDDLKGQVVELGRRMDAGFAEQREELRTEIGGLRNEMRTEIGGLRNEMSTEIGGLRGDLQSLNRTLLHLGAGMIGLIVTMALGFLSVIVSLP